MLICPSALGYQWLTKPARRRTSLLDLVELPMINFLTIMNNDVKYVSGFRCADED